MAGSKERTLMSEGGEARNHETVLGEEDREPATTHQDALAAACGTEADGPPPQGEDHEA